MSSSMSGNGSSDTTQPLVTDPKALFAAWPQPAVDPDAATQVINANANGADVLEHGALTLGTALSPVAQTGADSVQTLALTVPGVRALQGEQAQTAVALMTGDRQAAEARITNNKNAGLIVGAFALPVLLVLCLQPVVTSVQLPIAFSMVGILLTFIIVTKALLPYALNLGRGRLPLDDEEQYEQSVLNRLRQQGIAGNVVLACQASLQSGRKVQQGAKSVVRSVLMLLVALGCLIVNALWAIF